MMAITAIAILMAYSVMQTTHIFWMTKNREYANHTVIQTDKRDRITWILTAIQCFVRPSGKRWKNKKKLKKIKTFFKKNKKKVKKSKTIVKQSKKVNKLK